MAARAVTQTAVNLLLAWLVIRLAAALVPYAALARLIALLAWLVAALYIVHLVGPTLDLLDSVAIVIGGLRVSILTVVKGVLSLAMLLRAATVASNLFERRITRTSAGRSPGRRRSVRCSPDTVMPRIVDPSRMPTICPAAPLARADQCSSRSFRSRLARWRPPFAAPAASRPIPGSAGSPPR
jgi:hypothetical protein